MTPAREDLAKAVVDEVARLVGGDVHMSADLFDVGLDSVMLSQLVGSLNSRFDMAMNIVDAFDAPDIASFADLVADAAALGVVASQRRTPGATDRWLRARCDGPVMCSADSLDAAKRTTSS